MKDRFGTISKIIVIFISSMVLCMGIVLLFDSEFNGSVGDWFKVNFIHQYSGELMWPKLKSFITYIAITIVAVWTLTVIICYSLGKRHSTRIAANNTAKIIRDHLIFEEETVIIPKEYEDILPYLSEIKKQHEDNNRLVLEEVNKKNDLISYLAHDLKTPLTSAIGYLSLLEEVPEIPAEQKAKYIHIARSKAQRLETLINEFFDITRYNLHEIVLEREAIDLNYMLNQIADEFYPVLRAHGNTIHISADESITVNADPDKLARVFNNILKNAIAYSHRDTAIEIQAGITGSSVQIVFLNHGKTIPKQKLDLIFQKFYRMDDARSSNTGGAGLGLSIAREIILRHNGTITAHSANEVTIFTVELPM